MLSETDLTVTEGYSAGSSYTVKLATQPTGEVTVTVSGHAGTDLTLDKTTLTFTVDNWATAQTVTVRYSEGGLPWRTPLRGRTTPSRWSSRWWVLTVTADPSGRGELIGADPDGT